MKVGHFCQKGQWCRYDCHCRQKAHTERLTKKSCLSTPKTNIIHLFVTTESSIFWLENVQITCYRPNLVIDQTKKKKKKKELEIWQYETDKKFRQIQSQAQLKKIKTMTDTHNSTTNEFPTTRSCLSSIHSSLVSPLSAVSAIGRKLLL